MIVDVSTWEMHNVIKRGDQLRTRKGLVSIGLPTSGTQYVAGFTVESPFTTEPWHYLFEQDSNTGLVTLRVLTEELVEMFNDALGFMQPNPVITYAVGSNQILINSPSFSTPRYGLVGGGLIPAVKTASINPTTTALDIPAGHICTFGDRAPIAQGNVVFFNDPPSASSSDPRTYVAGNVLPLPGSVYDMMQGPDGALYIFTSKDVYVMPQDALGKGQLVAGFVSAIPGVNTSRPHNAISCAAGVVALTKDAVVVLNSAGIVRQIDIAPYKGKRSFSRYVEQDDLRLSGELYPTPDGFIVGFRGQRGHFIEVNTRLGYQSYVWSQTSSFNIVGTLRSRDGAVLYVFQDRIVMCAGNADYDAATIRGVLCGRVLIPPNNQPVTRRISVASSSIGSLVGSYVAGQPNTSTVPALGRDTVIGTAKWGVSQPINGRETRTVRLSCYVRDTDPQIEAVYDGGDRRIEAEVDVEVTGQGKERRDGGP